MFKIFTALRNGNFISKLLPENWCCLFCKALTLVTHCPRLLNMRCLFLRRNLYLVLRCALCVATAFYLWHNLWSAEGSDGRYPEPATPNLPNRIASFLSMTCFTQCLGYEVLPHLITLYNKLLVVSSFNGRSCLMFHVEKISYWRFITLTDDGLAVI